MTTEFDPPPPGFTKSNPLRRRADRPIGHIQPGPDDFTFAPQPPARPSVAPADHRIPLTPKGYLLTALTWWGSGILTALAVRFALDLLGV